MNKLVYILSCSRVAQLLAHMIAREKYKHNLFIKF